MRVNAGDDKEDAGPLCTSRSESAKPEDDCSLLFLHYLNTETEGGLEGEQHHHQGDYGKEQSAQARATRVFCNINIYLFKQGAIQIGKIGSSKAHALPERSGHY